MSQNDKAEAIDKMAVLDNKTYPWEQDSLWEWEFYGNGPEQK